MHKIYFELKEFGVEPTLAYKDDAGLNLYLPKNYEDTVLAPQEIKTIDLLISFKFPKDYFGWICGRSSLSSQGINVMNGIIDSGYSGTVKVTLQNVNAKETYTLNKDKAIAQLIMLKRPNVSFINYFTSDFIGTSKERKDNGFGSSDND